MIPTVETTYKIIEMYIHDKEGESSYWDLSINFWEDVKDKYMDEITEKQKDWLDQIEEALG